MLLLLLLWLTVTKGQEPDRVAVARHSAAIAAVAADAVLWSEWGFASSLAAPALTVLLALHPCLPPPRL